jgi:glycosyltransferase involved in cell wall biosynthesis
MTARRPLLFLSPVVPARQGNGLAMRAGFFLDAYARDFEIDLAVFPIISAPEGVTPFVQARIARVKIFSRPVMDAHFSLVAATIDPAARLSAFLRYGRPSLASRTGAAAQRDLEQWAGARRYDVVHVERLYVAPLAERWASLPPAARPRLVIDCDDDDASTYRRVAAIERARARPQAAAWAEAEADAFASMAPQMLRHFDLAFAASNADATSLSAHRVRVSLVPNVVPAQGARVVRQQRRGWNTVLFVATMGYAPNDDAAHWLVRRIWPRLRCGVPVRLVLVGSNPSPSLVRLGSQRDVTVTGTVADITPYYRDAALAVIPVRAGGGTRIKLLEAAAHGIPIVSTTLGAEGTTFRHGHEMLLADTEERFALACADLLEDQVRASRLARRARARVIRDYDPGRWGRRVGDMVARCLAKSRG